MGSSIGMLALQMAAPFGDIMESLGDASLLQGVHH